MRKFFIIMIFAVLAPFGAMAQALSEAQIKELVYEAILENPQIVMEAVAILQEREAALKEAEAAEALKSVRAKLEDDPNAAVMGNPNGDVTLVEFFDYNCSYCRAVFPSIKALLEEDKNLRIVMREWPILGEDSLIVARISLAARLQGKYEEFHVAMMQVRGRANEESAMMIAAEVGLDLDQLRRDMDGPEIVDHLEVSNALTQALDINGTPAFVIGEEFLPGAVELDQLKEAITFARAQKS